MVNVPISLGELIDKITILEIKHSKITDDDKLKNVTNELNRLLLVLGTKKLSDEVVECMKKLRSVNQQLWDIEDQIRIKEKHQEFDDEFVALARSVYFTNDERANLKKKINISTESEIIEEKEYVSY